MLELHPHHLVELLMSWEVGLTQNERGDYGFCYQAVRLPKLTVSERVTVGFAGLLGFFEEGKQALLLVGLSLL